MKEKSKVVDRFEYKGKEITVCKDDKENHFFLYVDDNGDEIYLDLKEIKKFINSPFSHTTINNNVLDIIEKSVKINNFLFNMKDLKVKLDKYN